MNKRMRILVLLLCGSVGVAIALAVARRPKPVAADPNLAVLPVSTAKGAADIETTSQAAETPNIEAAPKAEAAPKVETAAPAPNAVPVPAVESPAPFAGSALDKSLERLNQKFEDIHDEQLRYQKKVQAKLDDLQEQAERRSIPPRPRDAAGDAVAEDPSELPPPNGKPAPIKNEGDGQLSFDWKENTDIREALKLLNEQGLNILVSKNVTGTVSASLTNVDAETALAAILKNAGLIARREKGIIYVGTAQDFTNMDQAQDQQAMRVYRPNYVKALDLQSLISPLLTPAFGKVTVSSPSQVDIPSDQIKTGGNDFAGGDVVVVKDYENVLRQVDELYQEVDVKPAQVAIEAMIINVKLNDSNQFGVNFQALRDQNHSRLISGSNALTSLASMDIGNGGLKFGFLDSSLSTFILALETVGDTNVVASPRVLCMNKQRAEIQIGEQLGYLNTTVTQTFSTQSVQFLDVGTLLRIRPFIANDGFIRMEVHPELSTGTVTLTNGVTVPNKTVTQVTGNVGCYDGSTIVIGGLLRNDLQTTTSMVPFVGNLPWVGPLFRTKTEKIAKDEIIVLITPRIINEDTLCAESTKLGNEFTQRQSVYFDKMSPIAKRNYGLHYQRLALAAYRAGDHARAIKQIDWSIHFDPMNRASISLRNEIVEAGGFEDESVHEYLNHARAPWHRPHKDYTKQGVPWKSGPVYDGNERMQDEREPGTPGPLKTIPIDPVKIAP